MAADRDQLRQFIAASADDIVFLRQARDALLTHPRITTDDRSADAAMCRLMAIAAVAAIERILEAWRDAPFLESFNSDKVTNGEKIRLLRECLAAAGVTATEDTLDDYLAVKYLRNTLVHVRWKDQERQQIESRGFPTDLRRLDHQHWKRIVANIWRMLEHLSRAAFLTGIPIGDARLSEMTDLSIAASHADISRLASYLIGGPDLATLWWRNLEKLQAWVSRGVVAVEQDAEKLCAAALDSWGRYLDATVRANSLSPGIAERSVATLEQLHSLGLYSRAPIGVDLRALAVDSEGMRRVIEALRLDPTDAERAGRALEAIATIRGPDDLPIWSEKIPEELAAQVLPLFVSLPPELSREDVARALRAGHQVWRFMRNRTPLDLFLDQLARLVPRRRPECLEAGRTAFAMFKLRTTWYAWVESVKDYPQQPPYELWHHFERLVQEFEAG